MVRVVVNGEVRGSLLRSRLVVVHDVRREYDTALGVNVSAVANALRQLQKVVKREHCQESSALGTV